MITPGDPVPWFTVRSTVNPLFHFDTAGGRYLVLCFFGSASVAGSAAVLAAFAEQQARFDVTNLCFFGVSVDPEDERQNRLPVGHPGMVHFWDFDLAVSRLYGAVAEDGTYTPRTLVLDPAFRTIAVVPMGHDAAAHVASVFSVLHGAPAIASLSGFAPVLVAPYIFEPAFCRMLIELYEKQGGEESGFMREIDGKTVSVSDYRHKRRSDCSIEDPELIKAIQARIHRRLVPEIKKCFQFTVTRIERHIVACYDAATQGHFQPHRDNTTKGTAHRRFAVSINLNAEEFEGGNLRFPEFGSRAYRPPTGGAVVFSCSLLHEAQPVTKGKRYAFLPFLYDDAAAVIRQQNLKYLAK